MGSILPIGQQTYNACVPFVRRDRRPFAAITRAHEPYTEAFYIRQKPEKSGNKFSFISTTIPANGNMVLLAKLTHTHQGCGRRSPGVKTIEQLQFIFSLSSVWHERSTDTQLRWKIRSHSVHLVACADREKTETNTIAYAYITQ